MPVVPTLPAPATPNLAEAYGHGSRARLQKDQIRQAAVEAAQRLSLGYAQIAQQQQEAQMRHQAAQMEFQGKQALAQQEMLRQQQEMELTNAYRNAQIGLEKQNFDRLQSETAMKLKEAFEQQRVMTETRTALDEAETYAVPEYRNSLISEIERRSAILSGRNPPSYGSSIPRAPSTTTEVVPDPRGGDAGLVVTPEGATSGRFIPDRESSSTGEPRPIDVWRNQVDAIRDKMDSLLERMTRAREAGHHKMPPEDADKEGFRWLGYNNYKEMELELKRLQRDQNRIYDLGKSGTRLQAPTLVPGGAPTSGSSTNRIGRFGVSED